MKFIVFDRQNNVIFWTEYEECIPEKEVIKNLKENGYKVVNEFERKDKK